MEGKELSVDRVVVTEFCRELGFDPHDVLSVIVEPDGVTVEVLADVQRENLQGEGITAPDTNWVRVRLR